MSFKPIYILMRNIIVTGCNKGVGYGIVENLAAKPDWNIIMACRNVDLANGTMKELQGRFPNAKFSVEQLDVSDAKSVDEFVPRIKDKYKQIDVLVNNAGVAAKGDTFDAETVKWTFATNFYGTINLTEKMLPVISNKGKVITVGSMAGNMVFAKIKNEELRKKYRDETLTKEQLLELIGGFEAAVADNTWEAKGYPKSIYGVSKLCINLYMRILSRNKEVVEREIQVYSCCPGYVDTDMTSHKGPLTIQEGALTQVFLIELPFEVNKEYQGNFFQKSALSTLCPLE